MNDLMIQDGGALTLSDSDRIRAAAAWEALSVNSSDPIRGHGIGAVNGSLIGAYPSTIYPMN